MYFVLSALIEKIKTSCTSHDIDLKFAINIIKSNIITLNNKKGRLYMDKTHHGQYPHLAKCCRGSERG